MRSRIAVLLTVCLVLATFSGCVGQIPGDGAGGTGTTSPATDGTQSAQTTTFSDEKAHEVVDDIRAKQKNLSTYHAVEVEKRTYHLSNGSTYTRTQKIDTTQKYVDGAMLQRRAYLSSRTPVLIENRMNFISYDRANGTYR